MLKLNFRRAMIMLGLLAVPAIAQVTATGMASGQGTLDQGRKFALSARINADGTASGQAVLINRNLTAETSAQPSQLHVTVTCGKKLDDRTAIFGGTTQKTNDSNLVAGVTFAVQDNSDSAGGKDMISLAYPLDAIPAISSEARSCLDATLTDAPLEPIVGGNIQVR